MANHMTKSSTTGVSSHPWPRRTPRVRPLALSAAAVVVASLVAAGCSSSQPAARTPASSQPTVSSPSAGASGGLASLEAAAKKEGSVDFYAALDVATTRAISDGFTKKYGIKVTPTILQNAALSQRLVTEGQHNIHKWDVVSTAVPDDLATQHSMNILQPLTSVPAFATWPAAHKIQDYGVSVSYNLYTVLYNAKLVDSASVPASYQDLLKPEFKGAICGENPTLNANIAWQYIVIANATSPGFLANLGKNGIVLTPTFADCAQRIAAGESKVGLIAQSYVKSLNDAGADVKQWIPDQLAGAVRDFAVSRFASHPNAAALFIDYLMSPDGQQVMNGSFNLASPLSGIPGATQVPAGYKPLDAKAATAQAASLLKQLQGS